MASFFTNFDVVQNGLPEEMLEPARRFAVPVRNGKSLGEQFAVRYNVVTGHNAGLFVLKFHDKLLITGITTEDRSWLSHGKEMQTPFVW